jgi:Kef-type K+ transport system membrane component KefB
MMQTTYLALSHFKNIIAGHSILSVGLLLAAGYILGKLFERIRLPSITGYILAGLLMGESISGIITHKMTGNLHVLTEIALGIIALTIGGEFSLDKIRRTGVKIITITIFEAVCGFVFVSLFLTLAGFGLRYALLLGTIASATAPAATVIIVRELRARGEFIDYLYGVVAFDDAISVILFSIVFSLITPFLASLAIKPSVWKGIIHAFVEIIVSALLGFAGGWILHLTTKKKYKINEIMLIAISSLFIVIALSMAFKLSLLIAAMLMGATLINLSSKNRRIFSILEPITPPLFALFFILAGTELNIAVFAGGVTLLYGFIYLASRFAGKYTGVFFGALATRAPEGVRRYLGFCLFPQAGVAIGLALFLQTSPLLLQSSPEVRHMLVSIVNIILMIVFINELIGPVISRFGIVKGVDIERR